MLNQIDLSRADLNLLVLFETVMQERHVGRSAERLHLSSSAVSHGLGRLRVLLGDPLFLKMPKGVAPTARAMELAAPIADVLARVRNVISTAEPFDPARSFRRFALGAPDGAASVFVPPFLAAVRGAAPAIRIDVRQLLPRPGEPPALAWRDALAELDERVLDLAVLPLDDVPPRFTSRLLYQEDFVIAMRARHSFARDPSLDRYCAMQHLVVSSSGDSPGFVDVALAKRGLSRRIALTVPSFMFGLSILAETDLIAAMPRRFVAAHARRFALIQVEAPLPLRRFRVNLVAPKVAMMDAGLAWLAQVLETSLPEGSKARSPARRGGRRSR